MFVCRFIVRLLFLSITTKEEISRIIDINHDFGHRPITKKYNPKASLELYLGHLDSLIGNSKTVLRILAGMSGSLIDGIKLSRKVKDLKVLKKHLANINKMDENLHAAYFDKTNEYIDFFNNEFTARIKSRYYTTLYQCILNSVEIVNEELNGNNVDTFLGQIRYTIHEGSRKCFLPHSDYVKIRTLIVNILRNAIDAAKGIDPRNRKIKLTVKERRDSVYEISVCDNGVGMDKKAMLNFDSDGWSSKGSNRGYGLRQDMIGTAVRLGNFDFISGDDIGSYFNIEINGDIAEKEYQSSQKKIRLQRYGIMMMGIVSIALLLIYFYLPSDNIISFYEYRFESIMEWDQKTGEYHPGSASVPVRIVFYNSKRDSIGSLYAGDHRHFLDCFFENTLIRAEYQKSIFADLDNDGFKEILIGTNTAVVDPEDTINYNARLFFIEQDGSIGWKKELMLFNIYKDSIDDNYSRVQSLMVGDLDNDGEKEIVVVANKWYYPAQVLIIKPDGNVIFEYWHPGHLLISSYPVDIDADNKYELLLTGWNNMLGTAAVLVVLDINKGDGQAYPYRGKAFSKAKEELYMIYRAHPEIKRSWNTSNVSMIELLNKSGRLPDVEVEWKAKLSTGVNTTMNDLFAPLSSELESESDFKSWWNAVKDRGGIDRDYTREDIDLMCNPDYWEIYRRGEFVNKRAHDSLMNSFEQSRFIRIPE